LTTDHAKTHRHNDKRRNRFLKHKRVKHFLSNLSNNANETCASWYDVTHDDDFRRIAVLKRSLNFFFLSFCGVIYQNLLYRRVYIAVSSSKLLFRQFCEKPLHITFKLMSCTLSFQLVCNKEFENVHRWLRCPWNCWFQSAMQWSFHVCEQVCLAACFQQHINIIICPVATVHSMGQIIEFSLSLSVRLSVCLSVCLSALSRSHFLIDFHQKWHRGNDTKSKNEFVGGQHRTTHSPILPPKSQFWISVFKPNSQNIKACIFSKLL